MKHSKLLDTAIVAALLLTYVPGLAETVPPEVTPAALIMPVPSNKPLAQEDSAERLL